MVTIYKPVSMVTGSKPVPMVAFFKPVTMVNFVFVLFVLLLYFPSQQLWSWRDGQFT